MAGNDTTDAPRRRPGQSAVGGFSEASGELGECESDSGVSTKEWEGEIMCCCGKPVVNGEPGYKWQPNDTPSVRRVDPPELSDGDQLLLDLPGRCGGLDSHCHHYRLIKRHGHLELLVRHGGGDERMWLSGPLEKILLQLPLNDAYWLLNATHHAYRDGKTQAQRDEGIRWRTAAAEKRIKTRKLPAQGVVKVWIEDRAA
jgi:hypothetical protein